MRHAHTLPLTEAVKRRLLTLVLVTVLAWYTLVMPAPAGAFVRRPAFGDPPDAEERGAGGDAPVEDLDWPEYIDG